MNSIVSQERLTTILLGPHLSEKTTIVAEENNQVVFKVRTDATKAEISQAVEQLFEVKVDGINIVNCHGKKKSYGKTSGSRSNWKKAYVTLSPESQIEFSGNELS